MILLHVSIVWLGCISMVPEASAGPMREQEQPVILSMSYTVRLLSMTSDKLLIPPYEEMLTFVVHVAIIRLL